MRIAIIGPTAPYKGGIAQQTTELAHRLQAAGHDATIVSWKVMYPKLLYPGDQFAPAGSSEAKFANSSHDLSWKNPAGWWRQARKLRNYDQVIFVWWVPTIQGPVYLAMLRALGKHRPRTTIICHNVLPHEPRPGDKALTKAVLRRVDRVVTHTAPLADLAKQLTDKPVYIVSLPLALPGKPEAGKDRAHRATQHRLLFFGIVRKYKGLDVLLRAIALVPGVSLRVAGEFWNVDMYQNLATELGVTDRVTFDQGYVPNEALPQLFADCDALVLPYRSGTGSQHVAIAHSYHVPVVATRIPAFADQVTDGVDGLFCHPDDTTSLASAIRKLYEPGSYAQLQKGLPTLAVDTQWQTYLEACLGE